MIERRREGQRRILTNWKAVKAKAWRRRSLELKERGRFLYIGRERKSRRERERKREQVGKRQAARLSCHDGPRSSIFRAEIKWKNERTPSLEYPLGARRKT